jgi:uncharacterized protein with HEPN domain
MTEQEKWERLLGYYADVSDAAGLILEWVAATTKEDFCADRMRVAAVEREIEIIGEASKRIRDVQGERHPKDSDWFGAMQMRDFIAHRYDQVSPTILWNVALENVPKIRQAAQEGLAAAEAALAK